MKVSRVLFGTIMLLVFAALPATVGAQGASDCIVGADLKVEGSGPHTVIAPEGQVFTSIAVKSGVNVGCRIITTDGFEGCYSVSGLGTGVLTVEKIGSGPACQDISFIQVTWGVAGVIDNPPDDNGPPPDNGMVGGVNVGADGYGVLGSAYGSIGSVTTTPGPGAAQGAAVVGAQGVRGVSSIPVTGIAFALPLAGAALAAAGLVLGRRSR